MLIVISSVRIVLPIRWQAVCKCARQGWSEKPGLPRVFRIYFRFIIRSIVSGSTSHETPPSLLLSLDDGASFFTLIPAGEVNYEGRAGGTRTARGLPVVCRTRRALQFLQSVSSCNIGRARVHERYSTVVAIVFLLPTPHPKWGSGVLFPAIWIREAVSGGQRVRTLEAHFCQHDPRWARDWLVRSFRPLALGGRPLDRPAVGWSRACATVSCRKRYNSVEFLV